ncbi:hypothetical protein BJ742DRAFT_160920 [Cladochytrium replicatum]|nr:hypothetical protein BJ742DRAFT_160920 [Cladochytrium replicatum]
MEKLPVPDDDDMYIENVSPSLNVADENDYEVDLERGVDMNKSEVDHHSEDDTEDPEKYPTPPPTPHNEPLHDDYQSRNDVGSIQCDSRTRNISVGSHDSTVYSDDQRSPITLDDESVDHPLVTIQDFFSVNDLWSIQDSYFSRRIGADVFLFDEGEAPISEQSSEPRKQHSFVSQFARLLVREGRCRSVRVVLGGVGEFAKAYPDMVCSRSSVCMASLPRLPIVTKTSGSLFGAQPLPQGPFEPPTGSDYAPILNEGYSVGPGEFRYASNLNPSSTDSEVLSPAQIRALKAKQTHLIHSVWYGKSFPIGDEPLVILQPYLFLGSCFAARKECVQKYRIKHIIRLGWGFRNHCLDAGDVPGLELPGTTTVKRGNSLLNGPPQISLNLTLGAVISGDPASSLFFNENTTPSQTNDGSSSDDDEPIRRPPSSPNVLSGIPSVHYHDFSIEDSPNENISLLFERTNAIIDYAREHNERVLVHCHAGVSRSATVVLAYLVMRCGMSLKDAWEVTYRSRPIVRPNEGFAKMLVQMEKEARADRRKREEGGLEDVGAAVQGVEEDEGEGVSASLPSTSDMSTEAEAEDLEGEGSMPVFWMSESYGYYLDYLEFRSRLSWLDARKE